MESIHNDLCFEWCTIAFARWARLKFVVDSCMFLPKQVAIDTHHGLVWQSSIAAPSSKEKELLSSHSFGEVELPNPSCSVF